MPRLASNRLAKQLQRIAESSAYGDSGTLLHDTVSSLDEYGQPSVTTTSTAVSCSFTDKPAKENWQDFTDISEIDAEVRFTDATPASGDRFTITGRFDDTNYTDATFEIIDIQNRGAFGFVCALKKVAA